jgi:hypothetical protein
MFVSSPRSPVPETDLELSPPQDTIKKLQSEE